MSALKKVERAIALPKRGNTPSAPDLGAFLKQHALGLISHLSDMLQDAKNKASLPRKRAILRSMGALATHVGRAISNIAPQVCLSLSYPTHLVDPRNTVHVHLPNYGCHPRASRSHT